MTGRTTSGLRLPSLTHLAARAGFAPATVTRYGKTTTVHAAAITCLWYGVFGSRPVQVILIRDASATGYDLAVVTTDLNADPAQVIERYAARWSIEVAIEDSQQIFGAGQARNRIARAVRRTIPFQLACQALAMTWYATDGHDPADISEHRNRHPGTPPRLSHRPPTCSASCAASSSPPDFGHLTLTSQHPKKSACSAWPGRTPRHNRETGVTCVRVSYPSVV